jgi:hypothetical protein
MRTSVIWILLGAAALAVFGASGAEAQEAGRFGASGAVGAVGAPLGDIAEGYGLRAIPGAEYDVRLFTRSFRGNEWNLGLLLDSYRIRHDHAGVSTTTEFEYSSRAFVAGRYWSTSAGGAQLRFGVDLGWRHFTASSSRPDAYTGEMRASTVRGDAALFAAVYGVDLIAGATTVTPRLRLETSYPDFGGGDGYSRLHRENDLGFRASVGVEFRRSFSLR